MIEITEIYPNPPGKDQSNEWIEIYNPTESRIDLKNYELISYTNQGKINDSWSDEDVLAPHTYKLINLKLTNQGGSIHVREGPTVVQRQSYAKAPSGKSWQPQTAQHLFKTTTRWQWQSPTPAQTNAPIISKLLDYDAVYKLLEPAKQQFITHFKNNTNQFLGTTQLSELKSLTLISNHILPLPTSTIFATTALTSLSLMLIISMAAVYLVKPN